MQQMLATNVQYLAISVGVLIFIGGFAYLLNIKPFQDNLKELDKKISELASEVSLQTEKNKLLDAKIINDYKSNRKAIIAYKTNLENKFGELEGLILSKLDNLNLEISKKEESLQKLSFELSKKTAELGWTDNWNEYFTETRNKSHFSAFLSLWGAIKEANAGLLDWQLEMATSELIDLLENYGEKIKLHNDYNRWKETMTEAIKGAKVPEATKSKIYVLLSNEKSSSLADAKVTEA